jgi:plasmid replication initiation protein
MHHSEHPEGGCDGWSRASARHTATAHSSLAPDRYRQGDFFIADIQDVVPKGDLASMEHPLFALRPGDRRVRRYERNGLMVEVQPGAKGLATIHDKDVWIYCISQLVEGLNRGRGDPGRVVHFKAHSFLVATNRGTSGSSYSRLADSLERLRGTTIITNIETAGRRERHGFGLIDVSVRRWHVDTRSTGWSQASAGNQRCGNNSPI